MRVRFWGVRGSTPTPEGRNSRYGGNTCCIEVRLADNTLIILDCGSGLRRLGKSLLGEFGERPIQAYIFLTHFHWDHIQGIPFFLPLYRRGNTFLFHSVRREPDLRDTIEGQMANPYFPVDMSAMQAARHFYELEDGSVEIEGARVSFAPLNHPQGCVGYRVEADGGVVVLATDNEPGSPLHDRALRELARGTEVLVYDAQYAPAQVEGETKGWGHSSWLEGTRIARECEVKKLVLFHHDPDSDDAYIDGFVTKARREFPDVTAAAEAPEASGASRFDFALLNASAGSERRREYRYHLELPVRLEWRDETGRAQEAQGVVQDISKSGVYLIVPEEVKTDAPLEVELQFPDEIARFGNMGARFVAKAVRSQQVAGSANGRDSAVGVGARLDIPEKTTTEQVIIPCEEDVV